MFLHYLVINKKVFFKNDFKKKNLLFFCKFTNKFTKLKIRLVCNSIVSLDLKDL